jgi:predicted PurR-regulated permease PerM
VRNLTRVWIPRGFGVAIVYVTFAAIVIAAGVAIGTVVVNQTKSSASRVDDYFTAAHGRPSYDTAAYRDVDRFQLWLNTHHLGGVKIQKQGHDFVNRIRKKDVSKYTGKVIDFVEGAAIGTIKFLFSLVLVIVVSIYMLLDMPRLRRAVDRRFPPTPDSPSLLPRIERSLASYVRAWAFGCWARWAGFPARTGTPCSSARGLRSPSCSPTWGPGSVRSRRSSTRWSCTRSRRSGSRCCSSESTRSKGTSSSRT